MKRNIHPGILSVGDIAKRIMPQRNRSRNPNTNLTRPGINLDAYYSFVYSFQKANSYRIISSVK